MAGRLPAALLVAGGAAVLILALALALGRMAAVPLAIALLGIEFVAALYVRGATASYAAVAYGTGLLVVAELAFWSLQVRTPSRAGPGVVKGQALVVAGLGVASAGVGSVAAFLAGAPVPGGLLLLAAGVGAIVVAVAVVAAIVWGTGVEGRGRME